MSLETSKKPIFVSLSPNVEKDDIWLALKLLFQPRKWKRGKAARLLEEKFKIVIRRKASISSRKSLMRLNPGKKIKPRSGFK